MNIMARSQALEVVTLLVLGGYFIYAGGSKWGDPGLFATQIDSYRLLPSWMSIYLAAGLPVYEVVAGALLVFRKTRRVGLMSILLMLVVFCAALLSALARGLDISCGCTGGDAVGPAGLTFSVLRNILFLAAGYRAYGIMARGPLPQSDESTASRSIGGRV